MVRGRRGDSKFLNRPVTFQSNRIGTSDSNLEASQVPKFVLLWTVSYIDVSRKPVLTYATSGNVVGGFGEYFIFSLSLECSAFSGRSMGPILKYS